MAFGTPSASGATHRRAVLGTLTRDASDDRLLLDRSLEGDREAFDRLARRHRRLVIGFAARLTRDRDEAEDVAAEAFARAYRSLDGFRGGSTLGTWLCRIVTNCYFDRRKRAARRPAISLDSPLDEEHIPRRERISADHFDPFQSVARRAAVRRMLMAIRDLPARQRELLVRFHVRGRSYEEIAESLGVPVGTVKSRLNRARLALRDKLVSDADLFE